MSKSRDDYLPMTKALKRDSEFVAATVMRNSSTIREIKDPRVAASLAYVIEQLPKVKADLNF